MEAAGVLSFLGKSYSVVTAVSGALLAAQATLPLSLFSLIQVSE